MSGLVLIPPSQRQQCRLPASHVAVVMRFSFVYASNVQNCADIRLCDLCRIRRGQHRVQAVDHVPRGLLDRHGRGAHLVRVMHMCQPLADLLASFVVVKSP